jgi:anti-sigma B factor antagonist
MVVFPAPAFDVRTSRREGRALLRLVGELDCATVGLAAAELELSADVPTLTIDLREITFMDSAGVHFLMDAGRAYAARGHALRLVRGGRSVHRILRLLDVEREFEFVDRPDLDLLAA